MAILEQHFGCDALGVKLLYTRVQCCVCYCCHCHCSVTGTQMVVADLTEPSKRADALAKLGLCFGIGMITGSTLGGTLSTRYG